MREDKKHLTIQELARIVGVSTSALRAWERRYSIFTPQRTQGGHRLYTHEDLKLFWFISHLRTQGNDLKQIANQGRDDLLKQATSYFDLSQPQSSPAQKESLPAEKTHLPLPFLKILEALKSDNTGEAISSLEQVYAISESALSFADNALDLMIQVGDHWHRGEISVAAEHALTARVKHMLLGLLYINNSETNSQQNEPPLALCATLPNELHELGLLRIALYLKSWGYRVTYLGANTPIVDIEYYCRRRKPNLVIVSCAMTLNRTSMLQSLNLLSTLVTQYCPVIVGGSGIYSLRSEDVADSKIILLKGINELKELAHECKKSPQKDPLALTNELKLKINH